LANEAEKNPGSPVAVAQVRKAFDVTNSSGRAPKPGGVASAFDKVTSPGENNDFLVTKARAFMSRLGISRKSKGALFVNGNSRSPFWSHAVARVPAFSDIVQKNSSVARLAIAHYAVRSDSGRRLAVAATRIVLAKGGLVSEKFDRLEKLLGGAAGADGGAAGGLESAEHLALADEREAAGAQDSLAFLLSKAGVPLNGPYVTVNGRLLGPFSDPIEDFGAEDFALLETHERAQRISPLQKVIERLGLQPKSSKRYGFAG
ncbi:MAG: hypothetical protein BJ554DRAFT_1138, partial [Olpidium bornovanus]